MTAIFLSTTETTGEVTSGHGGGGGGSATNKMNQDWGQPEPALAYLSYEGEWVMVR